MSVSHLERLLNFPWLGALVNCDAKILPEKVAKFRILYLFLYLATIGSKTVISPNLNSVL